MGAMQTFIVGALATGTNHGIVRGIDYKDPTSVRIGVFIIRLILVDT